MIFRKSRKIRRNNEIAPDEIFLDSSNLPEFDKNQFEGQIEKPISKRSLFFTGLFFATVSVIFIVRIFTIQISDGQKYRNISENNRLHHSIVFAERGAITDRTGKLLAWNTIGSVGSTSTEPGEFSLRSYIEESGVHNLLGYVKYPKKDKYGFYYNTEYIGADGVEKYFNNLLSGSHGLKIIETDALGKVSSDSVLRPAIKGQNIALSIDAGAQKTLYSNIQEMARRSGFRGGAGIILDVNTGEVLASVSYPEYDSNVMTTGNDREKISSYLQSDSLPFLDRISSGLYTPGSIIKPIVAFAALAENIISPEKEIESTGELKVPNPYRPGEFTIFKDWKAHGFTDMREAIAVSSDVYFYQVGGGFPGQKGLGIDNIDKYAHIFGLGDSLVNNFYSGKKGVIPTPDWKKENFAGDIWRVGDTYNTAIGQYGFQVTPIQMARAIGALANGGKLVTPDLLSSTRRVELEKTGQIEKVIHKNISIDEKDNGGNGSASGDGAGDKGGVGKKDWYDVVREGMRLTVTEGTMSGLNFPFVKVAGKTGTAQLGLNNRYINSWAVGFFPYEKPRYAFVVMLERGPSDATLGATAAMVEWFNWMNIYEPEYLQVI